MKRQLLLWQKMKSECVGRIYIDYRIYIYESLLDKENHEELGKRPEKRYLCDVRKKKGERERVGGFEIYNQHIMDVDNISIWTFRQSLPPRMCERYGRPSRWYPPLSIQTGFLEIG